MNDILLKAYYSILYQTAPVVLSLLSLITQLGVLSQPSSPLPCLCLISMLVLILLPHLQVRVNGILILMAPA